jgi:hypothetical protein
MGHRPRDTQIGRFMQRAERCVKLSEDMAVELSDGALRSALPTATRELVVELEAMGDSYRAMVNNDPALVKRLRRLRDDWHEPEPPIAIAEHLEVIDQSVSEGILTEETGEILREMAEGLEDDAASDERRRRRFVETMRNMPRAVVGWLWTHKWKLVALGGTAITGIEMATTKLERAAHWLVTHADWLQRIFADDPHILKLIKKLLDLTKGLPPPG